MNYLILSSPYKKGIQIVLSLVLGIAALGSGTAHASGLCVHPMGAGHCFTSIQAAVDAANDGDQIIIRPGIYAEQITIIGKNLSLIGRRGAVIQAPEGMQDTLSPIAGYEARPIILVAEAQVTIRDLLIDGVNSAASNPFLDGIFFLNADGAIRGNIIKNIGFGVPTATEGGGYQGEAVYVVNFGATPRTVTIAENYIANYNASGMTIFGQGTPEDPSLGSLTVNVVNNTVIGSGPTDVLSQWGIFVGGYEGAQMTGSVKGNRIRDIIAINQYPGVGIAMQDTTNLEISGNTIENVNVGLNVSGLGTQVLENRFKKMDTGILLVVETPQYGGNALGTTLEDNRFDNVYLDIMTTAPGMFEAAAKTMSEGASKPDQPKRLPR